MPKIRRIASCLLLCALFWTSTALAKDFWTEGALELRGHTVELHAIVDDAMPQPLRQLQLKGRAIDAATFRAALEKYFILHPSFGGENSQITDDFFISQWADGYSAAIAYDDRLLTETEIERLFPVEDPALQALYARCKAFLAELNITASEHTGYICRQTQRMGECTVALLPYRSEGLSTEYRSQLVHRDSLTHVRSSGGAHIMDQPWAAFVFDTQDRLVKAEVFTYTVVSVQPLKGTPISWEQAAESALGAVIATQTALRRSLAHQPDYDEAQFWRDYRVRLSRALPMLMPNWSSVCIFGWCIQFQLYDASDGTFLYADSVCVDALTGVPARTTAS